MRPIVAKFLIRDPRSRERINVARPVSEGGASDAGDYWRDSWFEEGTRLIYIVPSRAVEAILPLHVDPPSQTARVFVGRIELIPPEATRAAQASIAKGDLNALQRYGRFLGAILERIVFENPAMADRVARIGPEIPGDCR